jgi:hypothetical protein
MLSPARRVVVLLLAAAAAPEAAQAFVGAPALPPTGRPGALHRHVYSLQMMSKPDERSLRTRVATKFAALVSALVVGAGAMPQASNAKTAVEEKAPATAISRMIPADVQATVTKAYEDIKVAVNTNTEAIKNAVQDADVQATVIKAYDDITVAVNKDRMASAATVISAGGLTYVMAKTPKKFARTAAAPAPAAAMPVPKAVLREDPHEVLLRVKKAEMAAAGRYKSGARWTLTLTKETQITP